VFSANVDPHFAGNLILSFTPENSVAVEEAYGQFLTAPYGLTPKLGRFLSGIGYLNEQHAHAWDFVDAPLAYQAFLGGRYANDGVQVKWIAPTEHFLELGGELGNGANFPGTERNRNGANAGAIYAHTGGDIGVSHSWRAGLSWLSTHAEDRADGFTGKSRVAIADFVWKYAPGGNSRETSVKVQGEYFTRREVARQSGWYLQGVWQLHPEWRVGARLDRLDPGGAPYDAEGALLESPGFKPKRGSLMVDYNPSEFSRIRLQYARSETQPGVPDNQWFLQYILSLGAHGAHRY
jgi:outer membrane receptor protein involved in Fe transport